MFILKLRVGDPQCCISVRFPFANFDTEVQRFVRQPVDVRRRTIGIILAAGGDQFPSQPRLKSNPGHWSFRGGWRRQIVGLCRLSSFAEVIVIAFPLGSDLERVLLLGDRAEDRGLGLSAWRKKIQDAIKSPFIGSNRCSG